MNELSIKINGKKYTLNVSAEETLLDILRDRLYLTGTKRGCEVGECGACTVIMNGRAVNACLVLALQADGADVKTIEGLDKNGKLHALQEAFLKYDAVHCGYCTPGMILSALNLLERNPHPAEAEIREAIAGNLCRCSGYKQIVEAIQSVI